MSPQHLLPFRAILTNGWGVLTNTANLHLLNPMDEQGLVNAKSSDCIIAEVMWVDNAGYVRCSVDEPLASHIILRNSRKQDDLVNVGFCKIGKVGLKCTVKVVSVDQDHVKLWKLAKSVWSVRSKSSALTGTRVSESDLQAIYKTV